MADLCYQCSMTIEGKDFKELAGITPVISYMLGEAVLVLCEGCGMIQVDPAGHCISNDCLEEGHGRTAQKERSSGSITN